MRIQFLVLSLFAVLFASLGGVAGLGASGAAQSVRPPVYEGDASVRATLDGRGASLSLKRGVRVEVPAAASARGLMTLNQTAAPTRPWPFAIPFRATGTSAQLTGAVRGSRAPVALSISVGRTRPQPRPGEQLVFVVEFVGNPPASGGDDRRATSLDPLLVLGRTLSTTGAGSSGAPTIFAGPAPTSGSGDPRTSALFEPAIERMPTPDRGAIGGGSAPQTTLSQPTVDGTPQTLYAVGLARFDAASGRVLASFPMDGELRRITFGFTNWTPPP